MPMLPQLTVTLAVELPEPSLLVDTFAVLLMTPHESFVVWLTRWTCLLAPEASVPQLQVSTPAEIEQPVSLLAASIDQLVPALTGSVSVTVTPRASPAPEFVAVTRNPIWSPALTVALSAVLVIPIWPQLTVSDA